MDENLQLKIDSLAKDEEYMKHLFSLGSAEEMSKELEKEDIELSPDELRQIYYLAKKKENGELSDEDLEQVSGGIGFVAAVWIAVGVVTGLYGGGMALSCILGK